MAVKNGTISISTRGNGDVVNITDELNRFVTKSGISDGTLTVFVPGSTASITTIEYEPGLVKDIPRVLEHLIPYGDKYYHHDTWHDDNGSSHVQAAILGPSLSIPCVNGYLTLGTWQQVVCVDSDTRSRKRELILQIVY